MKGVGWGFEVGDLGWRFGGEGFGVGVSWGEGFGGGDFGVGGFGVRVLG